MAALIALVTGIGGFALAGFGLGWAGFEEAPTWAIVCAFVAAFLNLSLFSMVGESVIEDGIKVVLVGIIFVAAPESQWFDPIKAGMLAGALGAFAGNYISKLGPRKHGPRPRYANAANANALSEHEKSKRQKTKAERRREDDEERRKRNEAGRKNHGAGKTARRESDE